MSRAVSTVVDVTVFLLLVGAAAAVLSSNAAVEQPSTANPASRQAELLGTSTANVSYALDPPGSPPNWTTNATARHHRTAGGTLAELLAAATMSGVGMDDRRLSTAGRGFERAVANSTRSRLVERDRLTAVRVHWEPYRGAPIDAKMRLGRRPPPSADVRAATLSVPSPMADVSAKAERSAQTRGYDGVASVVARAVVNGLFPPERTRLARAGDYPANELTTARYRRLATLTDAGELRVTEESPETLNDRVQRALAAELSRDMRTRFDDPTAAAETIRTGTVRITVRTWEP